MTELFDFDHDDHPSLRRRHSEVADFQSDDQGEDCFADANQSLQDIENDIPSTITQVVPISDGFVSSQTEEFVTHKKIGKDDFDFLKLIGTGGYAKVYLVKKKATGKVFAMKVLKKASIVVTTPNCPNQAPVAKKQAKGPKVVDPKSVKTERNILELVRHPFIVQFFYAFQTDFRLYLILEYAPGGELFQFMCKQTMVLEDQASFYISEIVLALEHLHGLGIIYRDLKPENVLLDAEGHILLTDFGLSKVGVDEDGKTNTICGTVEYMAPEMFCAKQRYNQSVDWWSLGIMLYDMLTGSPPFTGPNRKKTMDAIINKKFSPPKYISPDGRTLLTKLLKKHPIARLQTGEDVKSQRFFQKMDWERLLKRQVPPPFIPVITGPEDCSNFRVSFTDADPVETPPNLLHGPLSDSRSSLFSGFSYVAPEFLTENSSTQAPST